MKKLSILLILSFAILLFESCRKEETNVEDPEITIDPSEEIEYPVVTGIVTNNGVPIAEASVNVYQNELLVGTILSDADGKFNTSKHELEKESKVTIEVSKSEFASAYRRKKITDFIDKELEINLISLDIFDIDSAPVENPGSESLISLSGYIKDLLGQPSIAYIGVQWEMGNINYASTTYPDLDGYYELLLPINTEVKLSISDTICENYLTEEEVGIFLGLQAEYFGPFGDDVIIPDYINPITSKPVIVLEGVVYDCSGEPTVGGEITFHFNDNETFDHYIVYTLDNEGVFSFANSLCLKLPYDLTIFANDYLNNKTTDTLSYTILEPQLQITLTDFAACNQGDLDASLVTITSEGTTYSYSQTIVRKEGGHLISDEQTLNGSTFRIPDAALGTNLMENFSALNWGTGDVFVGVEGSIDLQITTLSEHKALGTFSGSFINKENVEVEANGQIDLNF